ncbi:uncharacterized protein MYCFIDRAFT_194175 [Pseudocercospora fijiensis CIRAD86]|uniref:Uncharacterized protein n=1 Tax=Pseudocercospora fijiensis (strain CIRAD86) TaxID=383855 RepID=M3B9J3_PSEFD|nr:uncharacterized protein MYCFIDRAFT_194175 [Pseudocercospora fijiensis CIRAD86]EME85997.1 hypothetical protein MYCFIDRAFT_194175 [Pseudocercospora fijiensis CIRAD86]
MKLPRRSLSGLLLLAASLGAVQCIPAGEPSTLTAITPQSTLSGVPKTAILEGTVPSAFITPAPIHHVARADNFFTTTISGTTITSECSAGVTSFTYSLCNPKPCSQKTHRKCIETFTVPENQYLTVTTVSSTVTSTSAGSTTTFRSTSTSKGFPSATATATARPNGTVSVPIGVALRDGIRAIVRKFCPGWSTEDGPSLGCWEPAADEELIQLVTGNGFMPLGFDVVQGDPTLSQIGENVTYAQTFGVHIIKDGITLAIQCNQPIGTMLEIPADIAAADAQAVLDEFGDRDPSSPTASGSSSVVEAKTLTPICVVSSQPAIASEDESLIVSFLGQYFQQHPMGITSTSSGTAAGNDAGVTFVPSTASVIKTEAICHTTDPISLGKVHPAQITEAAKSFYSTLHDEKVAVTSYVEPDRDFVYNKFEQDGLKGVRYYVFEEILSDKGYALALSVQYLKEACKSEYQGTVDFQYFNEDQFVKKFMGEKISKACYEQTEGSQKKPPMGGNTFNDECIQFQAKLSNVKPTPGKPWPKPLPTDYLPVGFGQGHDKLVECNNPRSPDVPQPLIEDNPIADKAAKFFQSLNASGTSAHQSAPAQKGRIPPIEFFHWGSGKEEGFKAVVFKDVPIILDSDKGNSKNDYALVLSVQYLAGTCVTDSSDADASWTFKFGDMQKVFFIGNFIDPQIKSCAMKPINHDEWATFGGAWFEKCVAYNTSLIDISGNSVWVQKDVKAGHMFLTVDPGTRHANETVLSNKVLGDDEVTAWPWSGEIIGN